MPPRFLILLFASAAILAAEPEVDPKDLPRFPAVEPAEAAKTFVLREGFKAELAASEPNVVSPVALSFDEDGRMYVAEMRDYSEHRDEKLGRIRLLEDTDGNGLFEKSAIFAEGLAWPTAVICYGGGVFVGATPDILFLRDTNGDGKADERRVVFTGFGKDVPRLNVQQLLNSFHWGLDNRIHGANGGNGGTIEQVASGAPTLRLGTRDFSFDPRTLVMRAETGGGQHGMSFDDFGRKFVSNNSSHIRMQVYEDRYVQGVTGISLPPGIVDIAREGPAAEVFRISPEEPWRTIRTRWRVAGQVPGPIEGGGRASGYFTGATGVTIYRGDAYPPEFRGNAFVGDAGGNLVHRKILEPDGVLFEAHRAPDELNREFLASRDTWFRPVQFANAPDGCLYIIDMYREVIEHPWSIPQNLKKLIDLDSGRERGRVWRIAPESFRSRPAIKFSKAPLRELIAAIDQPNGWRRDTAARLLFQRNDTNVTAGLKSLIKSGSPEGRVQALSLLASFGQLSSEDVRAAIKDRNPGVRERALIAYESLASDEQTSVEREFTKTFTTQRPEPRVNLQLAWSLAATKSERNALLARIATENPGDPWTLAAVLVAAGNHPNQLFQMMSVVDPRIDHSKDIDFLAQLAKRVDETLLQDALRRSAMFPNHPGGLQVGAAIAEALKARKIESHYLPPLFERAREKIADKSHPEIQQAAIRLLKFDDSPAARDIFTKFFLDSNPDPMRIDAFRFLAADPREASALLWKNWNSLPTAVRHNCLDIVLAGNEGPALVIDALKESQITRADLTAFQTQTLRQHSNPAISRPALELLGKVASDRAAVVEKFRPSLQKVGDPKLGEKIFTERCATCHRFLGKGAAVGPDLESVRGNGAEYLITHILDPNREVNSRYVSYQAELHDGESITGIVGRETDAEVTLRMANAEEKTIPRSQIKRLTASSQSLMPVGLEEGLNEGDIASLLKFILKNP